MSNPVPVNPLNIYYRGAFSYTFTVYDIDGAVVDLSGYEAILQMKADYDIPGETPGPVLYEASTALATLLIPAPLTGQVRTLFPDDDVEAYDFESAVYDCFVISPAGNAYPISRGPVTVYPSATDPTP